MGSSSHNSSSRLVFRNLSSLKASDQLLGSPTRRSKTLPFDPGASTKLPLTVSSFWHNLVSRSVAFNKTLGFTFFGLTHYSVLGHVCGYQQYGRLVNHLRCYQTQYGARRDNPVANLPWLRLYSNTCNPRISPGQLLRNNGIPIR